MKYLCRLLAATLWLALSAHASAEIIEPQNNSVSGLEVIEIVPIDERTVDVIFQSELLAVNPAVRVVVPTDYQYTTKRYPVIYLLHGGGGSHEDWTHLGAGAATAGKDVIVVQPGAGAGSWFVNAALPGQDGIRQQWERYIITQVIPWVDQHLRTINKREGRAIAGLSMGGYGTMMLAARHPHLFISASSFSGAIDLADSASIVDTDPVQVGTNLIKNLRDTLVGLPEALMSLPGFLGNLPTNLMHLPNSAANPLVENLLDPVLDNVPLISNWAGVSPLIEMRPPYTVFGPYPLDKQTRLSHNPVTLAANLKGMQLAFHYGNGIKGPLDGDQSAPAMPGPNEFMGWIQEDRVEGMNHRMEQKLRELGIGYQDCSVAEGSEESGYLEGSCAYGNGMHTGGYWARSFKDELPRILYAFENPLLYPSPALEQPAPKMENVLVNSSFEEDALAGWQCNIDSHCVVENNPEYVQTGANSVLVKAHTVPLTLTDPMSLPNSIASLLTDLPGTLTASTESLMGTGAKLASIAQALPDPKSGHDVQALFGLAWQDVHQTVSVTPFTVYRLQGMVRTAGAVLPQGEVGVRTTGDSIDHAIPAGLTMAKWHLGSGGDEFMPFELEVNTGANQAVTVYAGFVAVEEGPALWLDDVTFTPVVLEESAGVEEDGNTRGEDPVDEGLDNEENTPVDEPVEDNDSDATPEITAPPSGSEQAKPSSGSTAIGALGGWLLVGVILLFGRRRLR